MFYWLNKDLFKAYLIIFIVTVISSYSGVFLKEGMFLDDLGRYILGLDNRFHNGILHSSPGLAYLLHVAHILMVKSLVAARIYILTYLIIANLSLFYIMYCQFKFSWVSSLMASVFPSILIGQNLIPHFISGSYTVIGSVFLFISIIFANKYLVDKKIQYAIPFVILFLFSMLIMPNTVFLIPVTVFIYMYVNNYKIEKRIIFLISIEVLMGLLRAVQILLRGSGHDSISPTLIELPLVKSRLFASLFYIFPLSKGGPLTVIIESIIILISVIGFIIFINRMSGSLINRNLSPHVILHDLFPYILSVSWIISIGLTFWFLSPYFTSRYFHLAAYGSGLLVGTLWTEVVLMRKISKRIQKSIVFSMTLIVLLMSVQKNRVSYRDIRIENRKIDRIKSDVFKNSFLPESQIVIVGEDLGTGGYWNYSSGYIKYLSGNPQINGLIGFEFQFYNPFNKKEKHFETKMTGIDLDKPVFLFNRKLNGHLLPVEYALEWDASKWTEGIPGTNVLGGVPYEKMQSSTWKLFHFDTVSGQNSVAYSGKGIDEYNKAIANLGKNGIDESDILWAGPMSTDTKERFGLK